MATLTTKLTLTSANATSDALNLTSTDTLSVGEPTTGISRKSIATGSAQSVLASNSAFSYVYIKNKTLLFVIFVGLPNKSVTEINSVFGFNLFNNGPDQVPVQ